MIKKTYRHFQEFINYIILKSVIKRKINNLSVVHDPLGVGWDASVHSGVERVSASEAPGGDADDHVGVMRQGTSRVSLAGVLAADVQDASAQHSVSNVGPILVARLSLQVGVALGAKFLVDDVHVHVLELFGTAASLLQW